MLSLALAVAATAAPGNLLAATIDEDFMRANGGVRKEVPIADATPIHAALRTGDEWVDSLKKLHVDHPDGLRSRRSPPTVDTAHTTCAACVGANRYWNGVSCVTTDNGVAAFLVLGCFWGPGHETDCSKKCYFSVTADAGCGSGNDDDDDSSGSNCTTSSTGFESVSMKLGLESNIGAKLGITGPNTGIYSGYFIYPNYLTSTSMFDIFELSLSSVGFRNGRTSVTQGPLTPHLTVLFAIVPAGSFSSISSGPSFSFIASYIVLDAYYFYDKTVCANGLTASGSCGAETMLTQAQTYSFARAAGWEFRATGPRNDTEVAPGSDAKLSVYTFCATPSSTSTARLDAVCLRFTTLYVPFPTNWFSPSSGPTQAYGTYTCGTYSENVTLFDYKADILFDNIAYATSDMRLGIRLLSASQTGGINFESEEFVEPDEEVFSEGPVSIGMGTKLITSASARATCSDTEILGAVKSVAGGQLAVTSSATGTSCGYSAWFDATTSARLQSQGVTKVGCVLGSFVTTTQPTYILFDPTLSTNETAATAAFESANSASHVTGLGLVAMLGIVAANAAFVVGF